MSHTQSSNFIFLIVNTSEVIEIITEIFVSHPKDKLKMVKFWKFLQVM